MAEIDVAARRQLLEAANETPWYSNHIKIEFRPNMELMLAAVNDYGALLDEVERLRERVRALEEAEKQRQQRWWEARQQVMKTCADVELQRILATMDESTLDGVKP